MSLDWKRDLLKKLSLTKNNRMGRSGSSDFLFKKHDTFQGYATPFVPLESPMEQHYIDKLAEAELSYENWQIQNGMNVFERGVGPQDASEMQNLVAFNGFQNRSVDIAFPYEHSSDPLDVDDDFYDYEQVENTEELFQTFEAQQDVMDNVNRPEFMQTEPMDECNFNATEPVESMGPAPQEQEPEPMPDPMEDPMQMDPHDPMSMMDPMLMGPIRMLGPI